MKRLDALKKMRLMGMQDEWDPENCVAFVEKYVQLVRDDPGFSRCEGDDCLDADSVSRALGSQPKKKKEYGDIVLTRDYLGIHMGWAVATVHETEGAVRVPCPKAGLYWSV